jgi:endonuclease/exonuclease/phosphatase family metal-dependent hydrolase
MRVLSGNIAHPGFGSDPRRAWPRRREALRAVLERWDPDLLCLQEVSREQCDDLRRWLAGFGHHGQVPRIDLCDPLNSVFYRCARFALVAAGGYWLSEQPQVIGSRSWDSAYPRTAAWVRLTERSSGRELRVTVTHLDNVGALARAEQARLLVAEMATLPGDYPQVLAGDLNCAAASPAVAGIRRHFADTWEAVHGAVDPGPTCCGFDGTAAAAGGAGERIDWIFSRGLRVTAARMVRDAPGGVAPSDHCLLAADLQLEEDR